jgi:peptidoglycan hydrolase-like protein with peptidoglycan-binding domain
MTITLKLKLKIYFLIAIAFFIFPFFIKADYLQQETLFFIEPSYDFSHREKITATLQKITPQLYFYIENQWWQKLNYHERSKAKEALDDLAKEFESKIYPLLTSNFGFEWKPGIDEDERITILFHQMKEEVGGYFNSTDEYPKSQIEKSNEREMIYLNIEYLNEEIIKSFLAHEFLHLITFNQKEKLRGVSEEIWLNEARAEYAPTLLGYNEIYQESYLQKRVRKFLERPYDSLTEWQDLSYDYGALNLFFHYLVDHYGLKILIDSLHSEKIGIPSLNYALEKNGFKEDFSQIFTDWTIAVLINDCSLGEKYCYKNKNLKDFRVVPLTNFLPLSGKSILEVSEATKNWSGNWYKIVGGRETLKVEFSGSPEVNFKIPYILEDSANQYSINFFKLDNFQKGEILIPQFGKKIISLTIIPSIQSKISGFDGSEPSYSFSWKASTIIEKKEKLREELLAKIEELKREILRIKIKIAKVQSKKIPANFKFERDLSLGEKSLEVVWLKIILDREVEHQSWQGTDYFGKKTLEAVKAFQRKYKSEISKIVGYQISCNGFVGPGTRAKLNQLLKKI